MSATEQREDRWQQDAQTKTAKHQPETNKKERTGSMKQMLEFLLHWDIGEHDKLCVSVTIAVLA